MAASGSGSGTASGSKVAAGSKAAAGSKSAAGSTEPKVPDAKPAAADAPKKVTFKTAALAAIATAPKTEEPTKGKGKAKDTTPAPPAGSAPKEEPVLAVNHGDIGFEAPKRLIPPSGVS